MSSDSKKPAGTPESRLGIATVSSNGRTAARPESPPDGRAEARLRARVAELEAQLAQITQCLEDAETRAAELLAARDRITTLETQLGRASEAHDALRELERKYTIVTTSRSWLMTAPLRRRMERIRGFVGR